MCGDICPVSAIHFENDDCGFAYPRIDEAACIECGLCHSRCPAVAPTTPKGNFENPLCFAFQAKDPEIVNGSSSGGAFSTLAAYVLGKGGLVCGAAYDYEKGGVFHIAVDNGDDLAKLRTSKYVQSDASGIYVCVKKALQEGRLVLFSGCGCHVAAMRAFLNKDYENLILVDIVCHGVPSHMVFDKFLEGLKPSAKVTKVNFREKRDYGWTHTLDLSFSDGSGYFKPKWECGYYKAFLDGIATRLSCGSCPYNRLPRQGDLTFADFWDIQKFDKEFEGNNGVSLVLFNNFKHFGLTEVFREGGKAFKPEKLDNERAVNGNIFGSAHTSRSRDRFFSLLKKYPFEEALRRTTGRHFEIGIVGWWYGRNYGSFLTYFALNRFLKEKGYDVLMLSWPYKSKPFPAPVNDYVDKLIEDYYEYSMKRTFDEYPDLNKYCDLFMIGSDQMWNYWDQKGVGYYYFLDFVDDAHPKISYSTSFGHKRYEAPVTTTEIQKVLLKRFDAISVRENDGVDICREKFGLSVTRTIDPVFLIDHSYYEELISKSPADNQGRKYLFCYILTPTPEKGAILKTIAARLGLDLVIALDGQTNVEENRAKLGIEDVRMNLNVSQWLSLIKNADYVITDSFHGVCFSIIFRKQFSCMINQLRGSSRFDTLLGILDLGDRAFTQLEEVLDRGVRRQIDYKGVYDRLAKEISFSSEWLLNALDAALKGGKGK